MGSVKTDNNNILLSPLQLRQRWIHLCGIIRLQANISKELLNGVILLLNRYLKEIYLTVMVTGWPWSVLIPEIILSHHYGFFYPNSSINWAMDTIL